MGSLLASHLTSPNLSYDCDVWLVSSWREHVEAVNKQGLVKEEQMDHQAGDNIPLPSFKIEGVHATSDTDSVVLSGDDLHGKPPNLIFILVKSPNTHFAAQKAKQMIRKAEQIAAASSPTKTTPTTVTVLTLQNGMGNFETLQQVIAETSETPKTPLEPSPSSSTTPTTTSTTQTNPLESNYEHYRVHFIQGVTEHGARIIAPGRVRHTGRGSTTLVGDLSNPVNKMVADLLNQCGMPTSIHEDATSVIWGKLVLNAAINPITALLGLQNGQILTNAYARKMAQRAVTEAEKVATALGVALPYPNAWTKVQSLAYSTATNKSSMLMDMERGEETEINAINGVIVREGQKLGVDVEFNKQLVKAFSKLGSSMDL